ncbi:hypothetical protein [Roseiflexus castenholzii]|uniref:CRISPR-associated protein, TIGR02710 family n=1 Tax=Roseiflexus castenholzii (strain DSM 13941 / HLO8) TaxID=383372 RepID=A7NP50_ROSCS|nr:hypothetical protein [Roseiflexus castenholzii]ABU59346.1 conserved hypothetical protein [Roseiflexus castenholzii DSM 13941]
MGGKCDVDNLREQTRKYWKNNPDYEHYLQQLLGCELKIAAQEPDRLHGVDWPVHTLALTVGESFEPLLQVVCVLKPKRVVLVLNTSYSGTPGIDHGTLLKQYMLSLKQAPLPEQFRPDLADNSFELIELPKDTPTHVFRTLCKAFQKQEAQPPAGYTNVVDITGAKKSMVVGAFLYAAHSGLPITYVDFDEYDRDWHRPYGFTCRIGAVANPYAAFHLRDWEQVRRLYESYSFRNALVLLGTKHSPDRQGNGILGAMSQTLDVTANRESLFEPRDLEKVERLAELLRMYEEWENGNYAVAKKLRDSFNPPLPDDVAPWSIDVLGPIWPNVSAATTATKAAQQLLDEHLKLKHGDPAPTHSLFAQPEPLLAYVSDELAKIERLITKNEDYRSAYLRAAALDEFLLKARLCIAWLKDSLVLKDNSGSTSKVSDLSDADQIKGFKLLADHSGAGAMRDVLVRVNPLNLRQIGKEIVSGCPSLNKYWNRKALDFSHKNYQGFTKLRGEAIHTHLYLPRSVAEAALDWVKAAVDEFIQKWLEHFYPGMVAAATGRKERVAAPSWSRLVEVCDLTFLPPGLRQ